MRTACLVAATAVLAAGIAIHPAGAAAPDPGSLVRTTVQSQVGVVLDEIPASLRSRAATDLIAKPGSFWRQRAQTQLRLTNYRLVFRSAFYHPGRDALPLPPEPVWNVTLNGAPSRQTVDGHDIVAVNYTFSSVLLSDEASPGVSEQRLRSVGGTWREPFTLPVDPELIMQRTGYACMDEAQFPFASVDSDEVDTFYDDTAVVEPALSKEGYHQTVMPTQSCVDAIRDHIGRVETSILYERLPWSAAVADQFRYGRVTGEDPDLQIYEPDFAPSRTNYRYIHAEGSGGCEVEEHSVGGTGWRRLLQFDTSDENVGNHDLTIGGVDYFLSGKSGELDLHNLFELSPCHGHYHFKYYGDLSWSGGGVVSSSKLGFCLQSTGRPANRETSPLHNKFASCFYQGVAAGWLDKYQAGLSGQWIDTTDIPKGTGTRSFHSNPKGFLCEGKFVDENGVPLGPSDPVVWAPTGLIGENGEPVEAPLCRLSPTWDDNNTDSTQETIEPHGLGMINAPCARGQIGPLRNCGFGTRPDVARCTPGQPKTVTFSVKAGAAPQVVRLTEFSEVLGSPIPARYEDSWVPLQPGVSDQPTMLANFMVSDSAPATVTFTCPGPRTGGRFEPGGRYGIYTAPVLPGDPTASVSRN